MKNIADKGIKPSGLTPIPFDSDIIKTENLSASIYPNINKASKQNIAASQGLSSQIVYQDSSDSNYSSIKAMMAFAQIHWNIRWDDLYSMVLRPILKKVIMVGVDKGSINAPDFYKDTNKYFKLEVMRVTEIDIEPAKTAQADVSRIEAGIISKREICRRRGRNYEDVLHEILEDKKLEDNLMSELGIEKEVVVNEPNN